MARALFIKPPCLAQAVSRPNCSLQGCNIQVRLALLPTTIVRLATFRRRRRSNDGLRHGPSIAAGHCLHDSSRSIFHLHADGHLFSLASDDVNTEQSGLARQRRLVERRVHQFDSRTHAGVASLCFRVHSSRPNTPNRFRFHSFAAVLRTGGLQSFHLPFTTRVW